MENEFFKIFDDGRNEIGVASRSDVHKFGYWHETFHCWFVTKHRGIDCIYFQLRSDLKEDYPNLLDITVAGHLTANERVEDGVREIKEEVGIDVPFHDLEQLGIMEYCVTKEDFIDKELAHVFLYKCEHNLNDFIVQSDEVSGMAIAKLNDFRELWLGEKKTIEVSGFKIDKEGNRHRYVESVGKDKFVPHQLSFYKDVIQKIREKI
ncbi:isopentenyl-diphosphate delta-isomerase [Bacillus sp. THAF10]|uniref:NUDIX hydrolase n=1 Tax=Bacillus sp. THAF10 TaxID=2587848 RepID=UPI0012694F4E|nr:NUDIX domain-containing protein [Bacillus sp. THAF10]QFT87905.1 isopentenyl-diphosphate delta-isomerase [Bacillus sp. THAF10]